MKSKKFQTLFRQNKCMPRIQKKYSYITSFVDFQSGPLGMPCSEILVHKVRFCPSNTFLIRPFLGHNFDQDLRTLPNCQLTQIPTKLVVSVLLCDNVFAFHQNNSKNGSYFIIIILVPLSP